MKKFQLAYLVLVLLFNCSEASKKLLPLFGLGSGSDSSEGGISNSISENATLKKIVVEPPVLSIVEATHGEFTATAIYSDGTKVDVSSTVAWQSSSEDVKLDSSPTKTNSNSNSNSNSNAKAKEASSSSNKDSSIKKGVFRGDKGGTKAKIKATLQSITGESDLIVKSASVVSLEISQLPFIANGSNVPLKVVAILSDGTKQDITKSVEWTLSKGSMGTIIESGDQAGTFTALENGNISIEASLGNFTATLNSNISKTKIKSLAIEGNDKLVKGLSTSLKVVAVYEDGSHADVTSMANWLSEDKQILSVNNESLRGKIYGLEPGDSNIRASLQGLFAYKKVTVTAPKIVGIKIKESASVAAGYNYNYVAIGEFDDLTNRDITGSVTWEVDDPATAFVYNQTNPGMIQALKTGTVKVSASANGIVANSAFTVTPAQLVSISIGPSITIPNGLSQTLTAYGTYSDGTKKALTNEKDLIWNAKSDSVSVSNLFDSLGRVDAKKIGSSFITARLNNISSQPIEVVVSPAVLQSISIEPSNLSLPKGYNKNLTAYGFYSDNSKKDITSSVTWLLDSDNNGEGDSLLGGITNIDSPGLLKAGIEKEGKGKIIASLDSIKAESPFEVTTAVLESISISPVSVPKGITGSIKATGYYSDKTYKDITSEVSFTVNGKMTVDHQGNIATDIENLSDGVYDINASLDKKSASTTLTITNPILMAISLGPEVTIAKGQAVTLTATGIYSDKTKKDISKDVSWTGSISVGNSPADIGNVFGSTVGTYKVTANYGGKTASNNINVSPAYLESISIEPKSLTLPKGISGDLKVYGKYTDGIRDITSSVSWILDSNGDGQNDEILGNLSNLPNSSGSFSSSALSLAHWGNDPLISLFGGCSR